ncbi:MAG: putative membrane protein [Candidatus Gottesmanbacteria bacterium GW2011_GWA2_47_9]|uniref:Putative membrane protein n=1 Tax=Candidatus Gottesmanbacteria bacterium GW2011_GWA2_47_9 TaxID=1618445 RepID=A0A0G1TXA1_9BACT|nr:MAG: putative membrane protein [Candidatus Gottesmanbacteria bacterium GW2011_GWA2_47_9]
MSTPVCFRTIQLMPNLWIIFTTGLLAGGLTCMAVQGGLLATTIAGEDKGDGGDRESKGKIGAVLSFLAAKKLV